MSKKTVRERTSGFPFIGSTGREQAGVRQDPGRGRPLGALQPRSNRGQGPSRAVPRRGLGAAPAGTRGGGQDRPADRRRNGGRGKRRGGGPRGGAHSGRG